MDFNHLYFSFDGRIGRQTYWLNGVLVLTILYFIGAFFDAAIGADGVLLGILGIILIWPNLAIQVKRWHDRDKSGWWCLINLIPIIGWIWGLIELGFLEGTVGPNRFGEDSIGRQIVSYRNMPNSSNNSVPISSSLSSTNTESGSPSSRLAKAKKLLDDGLLTEDEYNSLKQKILEQM